MRNEPCIFSEDSIKVKQHLTVSERHLVHKLRAKTFCQELKWVGSPNDILESDDYDKDAVQIAVFIDGVIAGCIRLQPAGNRWMLDDVFIHLLPLGYPVCRDEDAMEASRLTVSRRFRYKPIHLNRTVMDYLLKGLYLYCRLRGVRYLYMVVSVTAQEYLRRRGFACRNIGSYTVMSDGLIATAALLDWEDFQQRSDVRRLDWYTGIESGWS
ncbi:MAG: acyl-homoserine-lactone synthase [Syntrophobacteraceae bacterium]